MNGDNYCGQKYEMSARYSQEEWQRRTFDADDLHAIRDALTAQSELALSPIHARPLRKLADLITETLKP